MARRLTLALVLMAVAAAAAAAQQPVSPDPSTYIDRLGNFDFAVRMNAARTIRRVPAARAVPALVEAVRSHRDEFVRYRALVLLTGFNDRGTPALMRSLLGDRNDRVREVAYRWLAAHPDPVMTATLLAALRTEQAEFVRPALVSAVAALDRDPQVQRALVAEAGRGLDFFRVAVVEALGLREAAYALEAIAALAAREGPIQDDAVLALGRIGGPRAAEAVAAVPVKGAELTASVHAARCLLAGECSAHVESLAGMALAPQASAQAARAAIVGLRAIAVEGDGAATDALAGIGRAERSGLRAEAAVALSVAAVRSPAHVLGWLDAIEADAAREAAYTLLRNGFERLEEDLAEEQFFAAARAAYWEAAEGSLSRTRLAALIDELNF